MTTPLERPDLVEYTELCYCIVDNMYIAQRYNASPSQGMDYPYAYCQPLPKEQWTSHRPCAHWLFTTTPRPYSDCDPSKPLPIGQYTCVYKKMENEQQQN